MKIEFKNNFIGYFRFYYSILGKSVLINLALCVLVSFADGLGLAMFIPLLQVVSGDTASTGDSMGQLQVLIDGLESMGIGLTLQVVLALLVILFIFKGLLKYVQLRYQVAMRHRFMKRVRYNLVDGLYSLSYKGFTKLDAGRIQNILIGEVQRLFQTMNSYFSAAQAFVMLGTYILLALLANVQFAIMVAVGAGLTNLLYRKIYILTKRASNELSKKGSDFNGFLIQAINHFKYLKVTNYFRQFDKKLKGVIDQTESVNRRIGSYNAITSSIKEPMIIIIVAAVIYTQVSFMGNSLTSIILSLLLFYRALTFLIVVQNHWQLFIGNIGAIQSISEYTHELERQKEPVQPETRTSVGQGIVLSDVSFSFDQKPVLFNVSLEIRKFKTIAFVGESGSGKSTLANVIAGLIPPDSGEVRIDGVPLEEINLYDYREKIGYISQEPVIFSDSIFNNITFWADRNAETEARFEEVLRLASLDEFIKSLPQGADTLLGDNGMLVSGGQRQRISIARELYKKPQLLILDEATSALDSETEKIVQENLEKLHGTFTMVIIAHRLSTIRKADTIYLLDRGRISASGDFDSLQLASEKFKRMVSLQEF